MAAKNDFSKIHALVVEDNNSGIALLGMFLRRLGISAVIDPTGKHTARLANSMKPLPDIILLDLNLPERSGFDIFKEIRADSALKDIPVVAVSAMDTDVAIPRCRKLGFNGFIAKPFSIKQFVDQLDLILDGKEVWIESLS